MQWDDVRYFLAAARQGSLAKAGRLLAVEHTTVARRIAALEDTMGCALVRRTPSGLRLTPAGEQLLDRAARAEAEMGDIERLAGTFDTEVSGEVRLATSVVLAEAFVIPAIVALRHDHPSLRVRLVLARGLANLLKGEVDIAFRLRPIGAHVAEPDVVAVRAGELPFGLYGAASLVRAHRPTPEDLGDVPMIRYGATEWEPGAAWLSSRSTDVTFQANDMRTVREACRAGVGLAVLPDVYADSLRVVASGVDRAVLFIAVHPDLKRVPRIHVVTQWLKDAVKRTTRDTRPE